MDLVSVQDLFRRTDDGDFEGLRRYLHPDLRVTLVGVDGAKEPLDLPAYQRFLEASLAHRRGLGERTEHLPTKVKFDGAFVAIRGQLRIARAKGPDEYHPYFDLWRLRDGRIVDYQIVYDF
jgi:ketosteroid isomerase-like protein